MRRVPPNRGNGPVRNRLTPQEARQAIYFDYEGRKGRDPVLFGYYESGHKDATVDDVRQAVVADTFAPLGRRTGLDTHSAGSSFAALAISALETRRLIVAWSRHELALAQRFLAGYPKLQHFERYYINGLDFARYWRNSMHPEWEFARRNGTRFRLEDFLAATDYSVPQAARSGQTGVGLGRLEELLSKGKAITEWTARDHQRWENIRLHNSHDILGMRHVCIRAADELAARH